MKGYENVTYLLPLAYFPAGEDPEARWGLTGLGQRALTDGWARGPEWTLLVSPDPREILSIEVRAGSRQEEIYRMAGYVTAAEPEIHGGHFLGLLEAFTEIAAAEDEALGRALRALEGLYVFFQHYKAAELLCSLRNDIEASLADAGEAIDAEFEEDAIPALIVRAREMKLAQEIADLKALNALLEEKLREGGN